MSYKNLLIQSAERTGNIACIGLDPEVHFLPNGLIRGEKNISHFKDMLEGLFKEMKIRGLVPAAFKPNYGAYEQCIDPYGKSYDGLNTLKNVFLLIREYFPETPIILDYKREDIGRSAARYARVGYDDIWKADAVTISPYMGEDSIREFTKHKNKGAYVLNLTSNKSASDIQKLELKDGRKVYEAIRDLIFNKWGKGDENLGAVVGATQEELASLVNIARYSGTQSRPMLIPGVGTQGGDAPTIVKILKGANYDIRLARINSSSKITHPWKGNGAPPNWLEVCLKNITQLIKECRI